MSRVGLTAQFYSTGLHHDHYDDVYWEGVSRTLLVGRGVLRAGCRGRFSFFYLRPELCGLGIQEDLKQQL